MHLGSRARRTRGEPRHFLLLRRHRRRRRPRQHRLRQIALRRRGEAERHQLPPAPSRSSHGGPRPLPPHPPAILEALRLDVPGVMKIAVRDTSLGYRSRKPKEVSRSAPFVTSIGDDIDKIEVSILLCNDGFLKSRINEWRGEACITDLFAASIQDDNVPTLKLGNMAISVETAARQAELIGHSLLDEVKAQVVHGLLRLLFTGQVTNGLKRAGSLRFYKPKFRYIFSDMDGTLLDSNSLVTEANAQAIMEAMARGINIVIATGKARPAVIEALNMVGLADIASDSSPGVHLQGLLVYGVDGKKLHQKNLDQDVCREALLYSLEKKVPLVAFRQDECYSISKETLVDFFHCVYHEPKANIVACASFQGSLACPAWRPIWKVWAPPRIKMFHWLTFLDRCWTAERLERHRLQHHLRFLLCDQAPETMRHLQIECPFSKQIWHDTLAWLRMTCRIPSNDDTFLFSWLTEAKGAATKPLRKGLNTTAMLLPWMIWKHRNNCVFDKIQPSVSQLMNLIKDEAILWPQAGAFGLRAVLPRTWDVH